MASSAGSRASRGAFGAAHDGLPWWARVVFLGLAAAVVGLAAHGIIGLGGEGIHTYLDAWVSCAAEVVAAVICAVGALRAERNRLAWLLIAIALGAWAIRDRKSTRLNSSH